MKKYIKISRIDKIAYVLGGIEIFLILCFAVLGVIYGENFASIVFVIIAACFMICIIMHAAIMELIDRCLLVYEFDKEGITIRCSKFYQSRHNWSEVEDVAVCDMYHASRNAENFVMTIRISIGEEKDGPLNPNCAKNCWGKERWRTYEYNFIRIKQVVVLEYSKERLKFIKEMSGREIIDRRSPVGMKREIDL